jgi:hypothetical protein
MLVPRARLVDQEVEVAAQDLAVVEQLGSKSEVVDIADAVVAFAAIVVEVKAQMTGLHSHI